MSHLPRLKIKVFGYSGEDICELEQARYRFNYSTDVAYIVEGQSITSHEELVKLATQKNNKDKEFLEVLVISDLVGGG